MSSSIARLNQLGLAEFVRGVGPVFEHSPWIAEATWSKKPVASVAALLAALCEILKAAGEKSSSP